MLSVRNVSFGYDHTILDDVSFELSAGKTMALVGESGGGKSTLLRLIAGLENIQQGEITLNHHDIASPQIHTPPQARGIGMVFQSSALFPHLTVRHNIAFGLRHLNTKERDALVNDYSVRLQLTDLLSRYPETLSGGQKQRVALARALVRKPKLMLFDEPLSSLDADAAQKLRADIKRHIETEKMTSIIVTHNREEAEDMADVVLMLQRSKIVQL